MRFMADIQHDDRSKPSDSPGEERDSEPKSPPEVTPEDIKRDAEAADRFEASDN